MQLHLEDQTGVNIIRAYDASGFTINETRFNNSLLISPSRIEQDWFIESAAAFSVPDCEKLCGFEAEVILLGTGAQHVGVDPRLRIWFAERGMGLEVMDTGAACRTYNILATEGRRVAAALILIGGD